MTFPDDFWTQALFLTPLAVVAFVWITYRRYLAPEVFRDAPQRPPGIDASDLLMGLGLMLLGMVAMSFIARSLLPNLPTDGTLTPRQHSYRSLLGQACTQLPVALLLVTRSFQHGAGFAGVGLIFKHPIRYILTAFAAFLIGTPLVLWITHTAAAIALAFGQTLPEVGHQTLEQLTHSSDTVAIVLIALSAIVFAPILEELIFRGLLQNALTNMFGRTSQGKWQAIILTSILFTLIHTTAAWHTLPGLFALSLILGWLFEKRASIIPSIILHLTFNAFNITMVLLSPPPT